MSGLDPGRAGAAGRHPVDWELLADHLAGALDGTPEGAEVAALVATDPTWSRSAAELSAALDMVAAELSAVPAITMPADVSARLEAALAAAPPPEHGDTPDVADRVAAAPGSGGAAGPGRDGRGGIGPDGAGGRGPDGAGGTGPEGSRPGAGRSGRARGAGSRPGAGRRRLARWGGSLAVAAGVVAFAALGLTTLNGSLSGSDGAAEDSGGGYAATRGDADEAPAPAMSDGDDGDTFAGPAPVLTASGLDHTRATLRDAALSTEAAPQAGEMPGPDQGQDAASIRAAVDRALVPPALIAFVDEPARLDRCLVAVAQDAGTVREAIYRVDLATFEGEPAVVMWLRDAIGTSRARVSGPACGATPGDPDVRFAD